MGQLVGARVEEIGGNL